MSIVKVLLVLAAVIAPPLSGGASAAEVGLSLPDGFVPVGSTTITVPITLTNGEPVRGIQLDIRDVPAAFELASGSTCTPRATTAGATCLVSETPDDRIRVIVLNLSGGAIPAGDGPVVDLRLAFADGACAAGSSVTLELDEAEVGGVSGTPLETVLVDGVVRCDVPPPTPTMTVPAGPTQTPQPTLTPTPPRTATGSPPATPRPSGVDAKKAVSCQQAVAKLARKLFDKRLGNLQKCTAALVKCRLENRVGCEAKAAKVCDAAFDRIDQGRRVFVTKLGDSSKCDAGVLFGPLALGFESVRDECTARFGISVAGAHSLGECLARIQRCASDEILSRQIPQSRTRLQEVGRQLGGSECDD